MANELDPRTRKEVFLAGMLYGDPDDLPDPNTRDELFMKAIAETIKEGGVPSPEGADVGDVLTIGADGPEWAAPSGGDVYCHNITLEQDSTNKIVVSFSLFSASDTPLNTIPALIQYINTVLGKNKKIPASGIIYYSNNAKMCWVSFVGTHPTNDSLFLVGGAALVLTDQSGFQMDGGLSVGSSFTGVTDNVYKVS